MFKSPKKSLIFIYSLVSAFMTYIPLVKAQEAGDLVGPIGDALGLVFGLVSGLLQVLIELIKSTPYAGRAILAILVTMILYDELKRAPGIKGEGSTKKAGGIAVLIALITAIGIPDTLTDALFGSPNVFMSFIVGALILSFFKGDSRVSYFGRGVGHLALLYGFGSMTLFVENIGILRMVNGMFSVLVLFLMIYNFWKVGSGVGPTTGEAGSWLSNWWRNRGGNKSRGAGSSGGGTTPPTGGGTSSTSGGSSGTGNRTTGHSQKELIKLNKKVNGNAKVVMTKCQEIIDLLVHPEVDSNKIIKKINNSEKDIKTLIADFSKLKDYIDKLIITLNIDTNDILKKLRTNLNNITIYKNNIKGSNYSINREDIKNNLKSYLNLLIYCCKTILNEEINETQNYKKDKKLFDNENFEPSTGRNNFEKTPVKPNQKEEEKLLGIYWEREFNSIKRRTPITIEQLNEIIKFLNQMRDYIKNLGMTQQVIESFNKSNPMVKGVIVEINDIIKHMSILNEEFYRFAISQSNEMYAGYVAQYREKIEENKRKIETVLAPVNFEYLIQKRNDPKEQLAKAVDGMKNWCQQAIEYINDTLKIENEVNKRRMEMLAKLYKSEERKAA
ncbi:hypothetical protein J4404_02015 [Candidatus Woesearchaeota archaeon]|nr:hypothetical protein [Candidatus Woesearchaeota archaeon]